MIWFYHICASKCCQLSAVTVVDHPSSEAFADGVRLFVAAVDDSEQLMAGRPKLWRIASSCLDGQGVRSLSGTIEIEFISSAAVTSGTTRSSSRQRPTESATCQGETKQRNRNKLATIQGSDVVLPGRAGAM